jgi:hypothetical protein
MTSTFRVIVIIELAQVNLIDVVVESIELEEGDV